MGSLVTAETVSRVTATQIILSSQFGMLRFRKVDGYEVNGGKWNPARVTILDDLALNAIAERKASDERAGLIRRITSRGLKDLSTKTLRVVFLNATRAA